MGGSGGSGGTTGVACAPVPDTVEGCLLDGESTLTLPVSAAVKVISVVAVDRGCTDPSLDRLAESRNKVGAIQRLVLESMAGKRWTAFVRNAAMPLDIVHAGDMLDMSLDASFAGFSGKKQTLVLAKDGKIVLFVSTTKGMGSAPLPDLRRFGVEITDGGAVCDEPSGFCTVVKHRLRVTVAGDVQTVELGQKRDVGYLTISADAYDEYTKGNSGMSCDADGDAQLAGFARP